MYTQNSCIQYGSTPENEYACKNAILNTVAPNMSYCYNMYIFGVTLTRE